MKHVLLALGAFGLAAVLPQTAEAQGQGKGQGQEKAQAKEDRKERREEARERRAENRDRVEDRREQVRDRREDARDRAKDRREEARDRRKDLREEARDRREDRRDRIKDRREDARDRRIDRRDDRDFDRDFDRFRYGENQGRFDCPPGLAKKNNGCLPPGQAKQLYGQRIPARYADRRLSGVLQDWFGRDDRYDYRMGEDYIYRLDGDDVIGALIPLHDRRGYYYPVGTRYPSAYDTYNLPQQYRSYYDDDYYRYGDGAIYRVDPQTQLIRSVAALLTGDMAVGQPLPSSYDVYNVPYGYRDRYADDSRNRYRYSDGYIYRVDPTTMIVREIVEAII